MFLVYSRYFFTLLHLLDLSMNRVTRKTDHLPADFTTKKLLFSPVMDGLWLFVVSTFFFVPLVFYSDQIFKIILY